MFSASFSEDEDSVEAGEVFEDGVVLAMEKVADGQEMGQGLFGPTGMHADGVLWHGELDGGLSSALPIGELWCQAVVEILSRD